MQAKSTQEKMILTAYLAREEAIFFIRLLLYKHAFTCSDFTFTPPLLSSLLALHQLSQANENQAIRLVREGKSRQDGLRLLTAAKRISKFYLKRFQYFFPKFYQEIGLACNQQLAHLRLGFQNKDLDSFLKVVGFLVQFGREKYQDQMKRACQASSHYGFLYNIRQKNNFLERNNRNQKLLADGWDEWLFETISRAFSNLFTKLRFKGSSSNMLAEQSGQDSQSFTELAIKARKNYLQALSRSCAKHVQKKQSAIQSKQQQLLSSKTKMFFRPPKIRLKSLVQRSQFKIHVLHSPKTNSKKNFPHTQYTLLKSTVLQPLFQIQSLINMKAKLSMIMIKGRQSEFSIN